MRLALPLLTLAALGALCWHWPQPLVRWSVQPWHVRLSHAGTMLTLTLAVIGAWRPATWGSPVWLVSGFLVYTALEYLGHRFFIHRLPADVCGGHDDYPELGVALPFFVPPLVATACWIALGPAFVVGLLGGLIGCALVHDRAHRTPGSAHLRHHADPTGNFAITLPVWDTLGRTKQ